MNLAKIPKVILPAGQGFLSYLQKSLTNTTKRVTLFVVRTILKTTTGLLITIILFQSCITKKITIENAIQQECRVQVKTINGGKYKYSKLIRKDSIIYGIKKVKGGGITEQYLTYSKIHEVKRIYPGASAAVTVLAVVILFLAIPPVH